MSKSKQNICGMCGTAHNGNDTLCRICRKANPSLGFLDPRKQKNVGVAPTVLKAKTIDNSIPYPKGGVVIPHKEHRDYSATIVITTPDTLGENYRYCKHMIDEHTPGEHRIIIVESHFNEKPYNWARDINIGLRGAQNSDYYVILNDDVFVEEGWLDKLVECMKQDSKIGIVGVLLFYPGKKMIQHAGGAYNSNHDKSWEEIGMMPVKHDYQGAMATMAPGSLKQRDVPWCTGALLMVRGSCLKDIGLLDEKLVGHCDDVELCYRAWLKHWRVVYYPDVQAVHREAITRRQTLRDVPDFMKNATEYLCTILTEEDAKLVDVLVEKSNKRNYIKLKKLLHL